MALRDRPYGQFNFPVGLGGGDPDGLQAGIQEFRAIGAEATISEYRNGDETACRDVGIQLLSEDRTRVVQSWLLRGARIVKRVAGPFDAKGGDVAIEEIALGYERLDVA